MPKWLRSVVVVVVVVVLVVVSDTCHDVRCVCPQRHGDATRSH